MILDVKDKFDSRYTKKYIAIMADTIKPLIVPSKVTRYLWSTGVISEEEVQLINNAEMMQGIEKAVDTLLDKMQQRHVYWYSHFVEALRHAEMSEAVELLDIPELHTECAGFHQHGDQITFNATLNNLPAAPEPPTTQYGITQLHLVQNTTHFTEEEDTDTDFVMVSDIDTQGELYDDTVLPPVMDTQGETYDDTVLPPGNINGIYQPLHFVTFYAVPALDNSIYSKQIS
ncbi:uncharacterized protein LOC127863026 [Dreissena polymorpha]|uniref:uncharacterized protein LOC127863026 n=1 Tax=Dreissena polymorpha TaxID=45954 RepID=UPI002263BDBB|nr:uncharacterized protein LOC127863026 [Dreissena polymorpha]